MWKSLWRWLLRSGAIEAVVTEIVTDKLGKKDEPK